MRVNNNVQYFMLDCSSPHPPRSIPGLGKSVGAVREEVLDALGQPRLRRVVQRREAEVIPRAHLHAGPTPSVPMLLLASSGMGAAQAPVPAQPVVACCVCASGPTRVCAPGAWSDS